MRTVDWSATGLGPMESWKPSLRSAVNICLGSRFPIVMYWGSDLTVIYNDAYSQILGDKHPWALGKPCSVCWAEIWDTIGPMLKQVVATGQATWSDDLMLLLERRGRPEECYFSFSFSPVRVEDGSVGGVFTAVVETTQRVISARRLEILRQIGVKSMGARSAEEACERCVEAMAGSPSLPFALVYLNDLNDLSDGDRGPRLVAGAGLAAHSPVREADFWRDAFDATSSGNVATVELDRAPIEPAGEWPLGVAPTHAMVLSIGQKEANGASGFLVAAANPLRDLDAEYRAFFDLLGKQASGAVSDAYAHEAERKRSQALADLDRAKTEFFSNVSHEFRTPLTLLLGPLESLLLRAQAGSADAADLELAHRNALRLLKLVNTLLDFARIDSIRREAEFEPTDLAVYTSELAAVFRSGVERAGLRLVVECSPIDEPVYLDREMWEIVVFNLLSNALKFTLEGEIAVRVTQKDGRAELSVADTGAGISADAVPHIFDRFYRIREARSRTYEGAGIGLAMVKELVDIMHGTVQVTSEPGTGTTFTISLPVGASHLDPARVRSTHTNATRRMARTTYVAEASGWLKPSEVAAAAGDGAPAPRRSSVLLVDDNADMRSYVEDLLRAHWDVESVADGAEALEAIDRRRPDLVLTDVMMPRLDGFGLLEALRRNPQTRDVPVVMLSARAGEGSAVEGLERGADDYLIKPFSAQELIARVNANLALATMRAEVARGRAEIALAGERNSFLNMAAHELRTPLTVIGGYVDLILGGAVEWGSPSARQALEKVALKTKEGVRLVNQMLMAARMESGTIDVQPGLIDLRELARDTATRATGLAELQRRPVFTAIPDSAVPVVVDAALVTLILDNLVSNAIFHGAGPVTVEVVASPPAVRVSDHGEGVAAAARERIFEPFFQVDGNARTAGGAGLGLSVSRRLAELHGGRLVLEDTAEGASFLVTFPSAGAAAVASGGQPSGAEDDGVPERFSSAL